MNIHHELFDLVGALARRRFRLAESTYRRLGLNHTEARLLSLLADAGGDAPQEELSSKMTLDRSNAGRALQRLEALGYTARQTDPADKRAKRVSLTDEGSRIATEIRRLKREMADGFFRDLTESEARAALEILSKAGEEPKQGG